MVERPHIRRDLSDIERRLSGLVWIGRIYDVRYDPPRARVRYGDDAVSNWLPWMTARAQNDRTWQAPEVGEQVLVICPSGDRTQGVILGAVYRMDQPAPGDRASVHRIVYDDGTVDEYDREAHHRLIELRGPNGSMTIRSGTTEVVIKPGHVAIRADRIDFNDDR